MLLARFLVVAATAAASVVPAAAHADAGRLTLAPPPVQDEDRGGDRLTVTVQHAGDGTDGTYVLSCHPGGGTHPDVSAACDALDHRTVWGRDTFAPVADDSVCTMQYGGPATAHVTGTWAGRPVDASYDRSDGCEIGRWDRLVPLLPDLRPQGLA
ncbi:MULTISPECIES: SSI family serine proteinase inhibitor [unclassified Streptomyces]|uniref:SSI family serine proteinase inhibitor n=1 Tax=unclassified Streptomyces TaxID=2593676 RepID=UPI0022560FF4|nr:MULTISPECIES: SSI family serine proteinase inhibitor [unclassified Streptomyces]MCX5049398.1 subtilase-type protease inhibitor [Streptomyces sp. NBC_00474]MCX5055860.1 subtilase-type protease inhibitor [Streptomyces sp. NBC_00452]MCX5247284.1 subtilase-type protease inhibitor [Streptomyces sp. NBC_00201]MCX5286954.1 subtilase-type protease inhibitor [Streptomyces sp. NBC_00183]